MAPGTIFGCAHCPSKVTFRGAKDFLALQGVVPLDLSFDPTVNDFFVELSNANGVIYQGALLAGDIGRKGRRYAFKDASAKSGPGLRDEIFKVELFITKDGFWRFRVHAFTDLSAATEREMTVVLVIGGNAFDTTDLWDQAKKGYQIKRFTLP